MYSLMVTCSLLGPALADDAIDPAPVYGRTDALLYAQMIAYGAHAADRVLRWEEAGFPFRARINGGTIALAVWPYFVAGAALDMGPLYWIVGDSINLVAMGLGHFAGTGLEAPPGDLYLQWTTPSTNLLGVRSPVMGRVSQGIFAAVLATNVAHLASATVDGMRDGFSWRQRATADRKAWSLALVPAAEGTFAITLGGAW